MNTNPIPAIIMLLAGFITCILSIIQHTSLGRFTVTLFCVLVCFYILGCVLKLILDKTFNNKKNPLSDLESMADDDTADNQVEDVEDK